MLRKPCMNALTRTATEARAVAVIDDDPAVRQAAGNLLRSINVRVEVFASAEDFLDYPRIDVVACVVVDIRMPGMSGFDLQSYLVRQGRSLPTIFISGHQHTAWILRATQLGAAFLSKPFSENALLSALRRVCGERIKLPDLDRHTRNT
jgi:FixJ family two-component response regulator